MNRFFKATLAVLLSALMLFQAGHAGVSYAVEEIDKSINPAEQIELTVPEQYRDGENHFFFAQQDYSTGEKSGETLYIPIQRAGDLNAEAEITLKVFDLSAKHDVNYKVEIYKEDVTPELKYGDVSIVDLVLNADAQEEFEPSRDENELAELIHDAGGADFVDGEGNVVASVTTTPLDENGNPIEEPAAETPEQTAEPASDDAQNEEPAQTETKTTGTSSLREARNAYTGTVSDRQEMKGGDLSDLKNLGANVMSEEEFNEEMAGAVADDYPGKEYRLHFAAGEEAKFLVVTPLYSDAAEGDAQFMLTLKNASEGYAIGEDANPVSVTIIDEDEPEPVTVSLTAETVIAENGKAKITVTREGRLNAIKGVTVSSWDGSARQGDEYSGIGAKLYFPMGIQSRTVELPVYHGVEEKDFYVSISALNDETVELATTRVVIPAAEPEQEPEGELMETSMDRPITEAIRIHDLPVTMNNAWYQGGEYSQTGVRASTVINKAGYQAYAIFDTTQYGYAYDGIYIKYNNYCEYIRATVDLKKGFSNANGFKTIQCDEYVSEDNKNGRLTAFWGQQKSWDKTGVWAINVNNRGVAGTDSYIVCWYNTFHLIKRQFTISVQEPEVKHLLGVDDEFIKHNFMRVLLDGSTASTRTLWTEDSFSINAITPNGFLRLAGIEARMDNGGWYRIATIDDLSGTASVRMNADVINAMASRNCITWSENGHGRGGASYKGAITVRPVFEYRYTSVELKGDDKGNLLIRNPQPTLLWDFNSDNAENAYLGHNNTHEVSYAGEKDAQGNDYYTFTAQGTDPFVSLDRAAESADNVKWVKIRARNLNGASNLSLFACTDNKQFYENSRANVQLNSDKNWHEYVINVQEANKQTKGLSSSVWTGHLHYLRVDPMDENTFNGSQIQIDYIAFFPDEASARAFRATDPEPTILWDFNADNAMDPLMGTKVINQVWYTGGYDEAGFDVYTFTAHGSDPYVSIDTPVEDASKVAWAKIRVKNISGAEMLEFHASKNGRVDGDSKVQIHLDADSGWHEYVVNIPELNKTLRNLETSLWTGKLDYLRLDPMQGNTRYDSKIQIDYIAFFPDENSARAFRTDNLAPPTILWDFNADKGMDPLMGTKVRNEVSYTGEYDEDGFGVYTFTASGGDPYVSIDTPVEDASKVAWAKIRVKNISGAEMLEFHASKNGRVDGDSKVQVHLTADRGWSEYVVNIPELNKTLRNLETSLWTGKLDYLRLDPMQGNTRNGSKIQIDYIAFFPDENSAKQFRGPSVTNPGTYTYHLGDVINFDTKMSDAGIRGGYLPDGVDYELRKYSSTGEVINWSVDHYINGIFDLQLTGSSKGGNPVDHPHYILKPTFTQDRNRVLVVVSDYYYNNYLDTTKGLFAEGGYASVEHRDGEYYYVVDEDILANDIYELSAYTKDPDTVIPKWIVSGNKEFFGNTLYHRSSPRIEDNVIRLEAASGAHLCYVTLTGTVTTSTFNLLTGRSAADRIPVKGAYVAFGEYATWTDEDGSFTLPAIYYDSEANLRFTVTYNGVTDVREVRVPKNNAPKSDAYTMTGEKVSAITVSAGVIPVDNFAGNGARFVSAYANQYGQLVGSIHALAMNGQELTVTVRTTQGREYVSGNQTYTEHIKEVCLYFQDQTTGQIKGFYSSLDTPKDGAAARWSWNEDTGEFVLRINPFDPVHRDEWDAGDVLMAQLITDKKTELSAWVEGTDMVYEPVSTGYGVFADPNYEPRVLDYDIQDMAGMLQITPKTDEDGNPISNDKGGSLLADDEETRYSFGAFPYFGEITGAIHVLSKVTSSSNLSNDAQQLIKDLNSLADPDMSEGDDTELEEKTSGMTARVQISLFFKMDELVYGGVRFMVGVIGSTGGGDGYRSQHNPYRGFNELKAQMTAFNAASGDGDMIHNPANMGNLNPSDYGGAYFSFSAYIGFYLDYGYVEITKTDDNGTTVEMSHEMVYMGAGGFIGFSGKVGYTQGIMIVVVPAYFNLEGGLNITFFLGSAGNPEKTLASFKDDPGIHGQDFSFNFEVKGRIYVSGTFGVGLYKILGARATVGIGFEFGYSKNIPQWYPELFDTGWGYTTDSSFAGTIDVVITSIELYSASWPTPIADGFMAYFQELRRANKCISYVNAGIRDKQGSEAARAEAARRITELAALVDAYATDVDVIIERTNSLKKYAYDNEIISWVAKNAIDMNKQGGIIGGIINGVIQDDENPSGIRFHTNNHVNSEWVADDGELMAAYSPVKSSRLVEDAFAQPSAKILGIGNNKYLMVFLDDTASRDKMQAATLKWTVYDATDDSWTAPQTVQNDATVDGKPSLVDADNKVILSWASATDEKYNALKMEVKAELTAKTGVAPSDYDVQQALEADPARMMSIMDVFTVEFNKSTQRFGTITQLTDDEFYDDNPQAIYDYYTGDYIVMYYKTGQDDGYTDAGEKLMDMIAVSPDPEKTYGLIAYMLYNNQTNVKDTKGNTHAAGWAKDYYFPNETDDTLADQDRFLNQYGGQRFLPSSLREEDGGMTDPPIADLTVAHGYNGFAAYAFTVDKDFDLNTTEDKELYIQFYNFANHSTYVPIRVAGDKEVSREVYDRESDDFVTVTTTEQVDVGTPKLVRNGGSTFLFWREEGDTVKYLNVSEMLNAKVATKEDPTENDVTNAIRPDGSFATDAVTGRTYAPNVQKVDVSSQMTDEALEITDFEVINDAEDNLYIVWTDTVTQDYEDPDSGTTYPVLSQEIYASAMIQQEGAEYTVEDEEGKESSNASETARWSKPYRLTRENTFNDGVALTVDEDGGLIIVHNQYSKLMAQTEEEMMRLIHEGKIGLTQDAEGNYYAATLAYNSPVSLMVTRCDKVGSLEATAFAFSDDHPVANQAVTVAAAIENVGLTDAEGCMIDFYEYKNGVQGKKIESFESNEIIQVNTARQVKFVWIVPAEGAEGYSIQAVIKEKKAGGGYYDDVKSYSDSFKSEPKISLNVSEVQQEGDRFRVNYSVENIGNDDAAEGTSVGIHLVGLHGELDSDRYGNIRNSEIYSKDITDALKKKTAQRLISTKEDSLGNMSVLSKSIYEGDTLVDIPASVFRYCGYDALKIVVTDKDGVVIKESNELLVKLDKPMNLSLNGGERIRLNANDTKKVELSYDTTVFLPQDSVVYSVADPTVAVVDDEGRLTALSDGVTTLTATLLPSGKSVSVGVTVGKLNNPFKDVIDSKFYYDPVLWAYYIDPQITSGVTENTFVPNGVANRAQVVTFLWRAAGMPEPKSENNPFTDVADGKYYTKAVLWAAENGITTGTSSTTFSPNKTCNRGEFVTFLYRFAVSPKPDTENNPFTDVNEGRFYYDAVLWAYGKAITSGTAANTFSPSRSCSRGEIVTFLYRYMGG